MAVNYPDMEIYLYFIIPIKIKWIAILDAVLIGWEFINAPWYAKIIIAASLLNFVIFYLSTFNLKSSNAGKTYGSRRSSSAGSVFKRKNFTVMDGRVSKHKCAICGRTEHDDPSLEFRFCSKCNGNYEYCQDHLYTHKHVE